MIEATKEWIIENSAYLKGDANGTVVWCSMFGEERAVKNDSHFRTESNS